MMNSVGISSGIDTLTHMPAALPRAAVPSFRESTYHRRGALARTSCAEDLRQVSRELRVFAQKARKKQACLTGRTNPVVMARASRISGEPPGHFVPGVSRPSMPLEAYF